MTPYVQLLMQYIRPESQGAFYYDFRRFAKDPNVALLLTILLGLVGGEAYYMGEWKRGILMTIAMLSGIGMMISVPVWIARCFTISSECETYNDFLAYTLAYRYLPQGTAPQPPQPATPQNRTRPNISNLPVSVRA
jgi:hypothetical protein